MTMMPQGGPPLPPLGAGPLPGPGAPPPLPLGAGPPPLGPPGGLPGGLPGAPGGFPTTDPAFIGSLLGPSQMQDHLALAQQQLSAAQQGAGLSLATMLRSMANPAGSVATTQPGPMPTDLPPPGPPTGPTNGPDLYGG